MTVHLSIISWYSIEIAEHTKIVFGVGLPSVYPTVCCKAIRVHVSPKNKGTSLWNFVSNSGLVAGVVDLA